MDIMAISRSLTAVVIKYWLSICITVCSCTPSCSKSCSKCSVGQHCEGKEDGKKGSKMERESERDVGGGPSQTERAERARAMEGETESQAEINSKDESREVRRFSQLYNPTKFRPFSIIWIWTVQVQIPTFFHNHFLCYFIFQAGRREASVSDPPPPPLQTDSPSVKKTKFRPPPLKNTTDAGDKWVALPMICWKQFLLYHLLAFIAIFSCLLCLYSFVCF